MKLTVYGEFTAFYTPRWFITYRIAFILHLAHSSQQTHSLLRGGHQMAIQCLILFFSSSIDFSSIILTQLFGGQCAFIHTHTHTSSHAQRENYSDPQYCRNTNTMTKLCIHFYYIKRSPNKFFFGFSPLPVSSFCFSTSSSSSSPPLSSDVNNERRSYFLCT